MAFVNPCICSAVWCEYCFTVTTTRLLHSRVGSQEPLIYFIRHARHWLQMKVARHVHFRHVTLRNFPCNLRRNRIERQFARKIENSKLCKLTVRFTIKNDLPLLQKIEFKHVIRDLGSTLTGEHKHTVPNNSYGEVTTCWWPVSWLLNLKTTFIMINVFFCTCQRTRGYSEKKKT